MVALLSPPTKYWLLRHRGHWLSPISVIFAYGLFLPVIFSQLRNGDRYSGDGGDASAATLPGSSGPRHRCAGNVNICDTLANRIRTVDILWDPAPYPWRKHSRVFGDGSAATSAALPIAEGLQWTVPGSSFLPTPEIIGSEKSPL
jgi:hypothetical protein